MYMPPAKRKILGAQVAQAQGNNLGAHRCPSHTRAGPHGGKGNVARIERSS